MLETDVSEIANEMITSVKKGGRCGIIGAYAGYTNHFNIGALMEKGVRLIGNGQAPVHKWWKEILEDYILSGKLDPTLWAPCDNDTAFLDSHIDFLILSILTHRVSLEEFPELYKAFDKREGGVVKVFVETKFSSPPAPECPTLSRVSDWAKVWFPFLCDSAWGHW